MQKLIVYFCLVVLAAHQLQGKMFQIPAECQDFEKLCSQVVFGTVSYECDKTCTKFIVCYTMNDKPLGLIKQCPIGQYYNSSRKICTPQKPDNCS